jgi:glycerate kinase
MRVIVAPDSFKESLTALEAAAAMARGAASAGAVVDLCPVADGGEGTVEALVRATDGEVVRARVTGPLGEPVDAAWGLLGDGATAVVEMASAAGLPHVPPDARDPTSTTTFGVGELLRAALDSGRPRIALGLGGSATCDGGVGMAQALGVRFDGAPTRAAGRDLTRIRAIDTREADLRLESTEIVAACDVANPLLGTRGAAWVYARQKGATPGQVDDLERGLAHLAALLTDVDATEPGAGAAGGWAPVSSGASTSCWTRSGSARGSPGRIWC